MLAVTPQKDEIEILVKIYKIEEVDFPARDGHRRQRPDSDQGLWWLILHDP